MAAVVLGLSANAKAADIVDTAVAGKFTTLVAAVKAAGLVDTLKGAGPFTVFAPTDAAFNALPPTTLSDLFNPLNSAQLELLVRKHIATGTRKSAGFGNPTLQHAARPPAPHALIKSSTESLSVFGT